MFYQIFSLILVLVLAVAVATHMENYQRDKIICHLPVHRGYCKRGVFAWYYDPKQRTCVRFYYALCGGNKNRFYSREECLEVCLQNW